MARLGQWVLAGTCWGGGWDIAGAEEGSGGAKVNGLGWRGFGSRGCLVAIVAHIPGFLTGGGGVG